MTLLPPADTNQPMSSTSHLAVLLLLVAACDPPSNPECAEPQGCTLPNHPPSTTDEEEWIHEWLLGWDDPLGTGPTFVIDHLEVAPRGRFNAASPLASANDWIRQSLLGGEALALIELAGLTLAQPGDGITVKFYAARDADDPFFPANNFRTPAGESTCCEYLVGRESLSGLPPQARSRAPTNGIGSRFETITPMPLSLTLGEGLELRVDTAYVSAAISTGLEDGIIRGKLTPAMLARIPNPFCGTTSPLCTHLSPASSLLDSLATETPPDIDEDDDGLETFELGADGRVERCLDGPRSCAGAAECVTEQERVVLPLDPAQPSSCAFQPQMVDSWSIELRFTAAPARMVGIAPEARSGG